ncbi:MAG: hypothetical protein HQK65_22465 [Desulfamplus sp.]|nr:hypothetical protein [Desulfamplus sp.]
MNEEMKYTFKSICIDFDGVIAELVGSIEECGSPIKGAAEAISVLKEAGFKIIIHTARPDSEESIALIKNYLIENKIPFDSINQGVDSPWESKKPLADLYIDDRALRFEGDWASALVQAKKLLQIEPSNEIFEYSRILDFVDKRQEQVKKLNEFLELNTSWLKAPASTRFHLNVEGGLIQHSTNVVNTLLKLRQTLAPEISVESCVIVGLYHDLGKAGGVGEPMYLPNPSEWHVRNQNKRFMINPKLTHIDVPTRSLLHLSKFVDLTDEEAQAIRYHDGQYVDGNREVAHRETKLALLLQYADNWSGCILVTYPSTSSKKRGMTMLHDPINPLLMRQERP